MTNPGPLDRLYETTEGSRCEISFFVRVLFIHVGRFFGGSEYVFSRCEIFCFTWRQTNIFLPDFFLFLFALRDFFYLREYFFLHVERFVLLVRLSLVRSRIQILHTLFFSKKVISKKLGYTEN